MEDHIQILIQHLEMENKQSVNFTFDERLKIAKAIRKMGCRCD